MRILILLSLCLTCGCVSNLCDSKDPIDEIGKKINPVCIKYLEDKPVGYSESRANTILPILKTIDTIKKTEEGFEHIQSNEMLLGVIANMSTINSYDKTGNLTAIKYFSGRFTYGAILNVTKGAANNFNYHESTLLGGILATRKEYVNSANEVTQSDFSVLLNAFGFYTDGEDSYINYLWVPIRY